MVADVDHAGVEVRVNTSELDQSCPTQTCETVRDLRDRYRDREFRFVFGADSTETMESWDEGVELL